MLRNTPCSSSYAAGTLVTLVATPAINSIFTGWSGGLHRHRDDVQGADDGVEVGQCQVHQETMTGA